LCHEQFRIENVLGTPHGDYVYFIFFECFCFHKNQSPRRGKNNREGAAKLAIKLAYKFPCLQAVEKKQLMNKIEEIEFQKSDEKPMLIENRNSMFIIFDKTLLLRIKKNNHG
jgi:hypothetical protein